MAIVEAEIAVRRLLQTLSPTLPTAYEGISFVPPDGMYQRVQFVVNAPTDPTLGNYFYRENIEVQIFVVDKLDVGTSAALQRAEAIRNLFHKGLSLEEGGFRIQILRTPQVSGVSVGNDRLVVPVLIPLIVEVYT